MIEPRADEVGGVMEKGLGFAEYRDLVEQAPIMIWRAGTNTQCDYFNERWLAFTGRSTAQEMGNGWSEGVHADDLQRCLEIYLTAFEGRQVFEMEYRLRRHDGVYRWLLDRGVPFLDESGAFAGYVGSCIDINEQVEARERVRQMAEAELKKLRGLLPICSSCKKIRDDAGYWQVVEVYVRDHLDIDFSHGLCPDCLPRYFPDRALRREPRS
jgi:PAS domain S-box-containing protein